jgi:hypothetical protein
MAHSAALLVDRWTAFRDCLVSFSSVGKSKNIIFLWDSLSPCCLKTLRGRAGGGGGIAFSKVYIKLEGETGNHFGF